MPSFWDLHEAHKCIQEGDSLINKLRKPEAVRALSALAWFVRTIPNAPELLQEVRALAGRVTDGLDKPGADDYVNHPWMALMGQKGLTPFSYTASLRQAGIPQAPPPLPGHAPPWSYVPDPVAGPSTSPVGPLGPGAAQEEAAVEEEEDSIFSNMGTLTARTMGGGGDDDVGGDGGTGNRKDIFSNLGTLTLPGAANDGGGGRADGGGDGGDGEGDDVGDGAGDGGGPIPKGQVSDHSSLSISSLAAPPKQLAKAGVVGVGGLVDDGTSGSGVAHVGGAGGVNADGKGQGGPADRIRPRKRLVCPRIRRGDFCMDKDCQKEHPARCGDPRCFPAWRRDCPLWHVRASQSQGNGASAGPGRAGHLQSQGTGQQG